jgi:hypothetical protein
MRTMTRQLEACRTPCRQLARWRHLLLDFLSTAAASPTLLARFSARSRTAALRGCPDGPGRFLVGGWRQGGHGKTQLALSEPAQTDVLAPHEVMQLRSNHLKAELKRLHGVYPHRVPHVFIPQPSDLERAPPVFSGGRLRDGSADEHREFAVSSTLPEFESPFGDDLSQCRGHVVHVLLGISPWSRDTSCGRPCSWSSRWSALSWHSSQRMLGLTSGSRRRCPG